jgi:N-acetyl sugar amidotransferase
MDTTDPDIEFDENGVCQYWYEYQKAVQAMPQGKERERLLADTVADVRARGKGKKYDCILGLSGGVDSSYMAHLAKDLELRPLVVHFDNGWNNELAVANIEQIVTKLGFDLHTFVMDWDEFRDLQRAYFKASVLDLEVPTDHMIFGALYEIARKHGIVSILSGNNVATEWLLPRKWYYSKFDLVNIQEIHRQFGEGKLKKLPALGVWQQAYSQLFKGIRDIKLLDLVPYNKLEAKAFLMKEFEWRDYGGKHFESIFTRYYQGYILPNKFNIDKRKAHLSNLICSGEMTREEALAELENPPYDPKLQDQDKAYVAKKLGFSESEFEEILTQPNRDHSEFGNDRAQRARYFKMMRLAKPVTRIVKKVLRR